MDGDPDGCDQNLKLLTRTATNTYFLSRLRRHLVADRGGRILASCGEPRRRSSPRPPRSERSRRGEDVQFKGRGDAGALSTTGDILERLLRLRENAQSDLGRPRRSPNSMSSPAAGAKLATPAPDAKLYARGLYRQSSGATKCRRRLVPDHQPRRRAPATRGLVPVPGFTRFEAAPASMDG